MSERDTLAALLRAVRMILDTDYDGTVKEWRALHDALVAYEAAAVHVAPSPDAPGLRDVAQSFVDATEDDRIWAVLIDDGAIGPKLYVPDAVLDQMRNTRNALRAALALPPRDALDVERLARALEAAMSGKHVTPIALRSEFGLPAIWEPLADAIAREYAAQSKEPTDG